MENVILIIEKAISFIFENREWIFDGIFPSAIVMLYEIADKKLNKINKTEDFPQIIKNSYIVQEKDNISKQENIYTDLLQKPAKQVGESLEGLMKFVALPFKFLGMTADELEKKYKKFILDSLKKIPEGKLAAPYPDIVSKILDGVKFTFTSEKNNILNEMFSALLASSVNTDRQSFIHPSYIANLNNMSFIDAYICKFLLTHNKILVSKFSFCRDYKRKNKPLASMAPVFSIRKDNYYEKIEIDISTTEFEKSISFLESVGIIYNTHEFFQSIDEYVQNIQNINRDKKPRDYISHMSRFYSYVYNNYTKHTIDEKYEIGDRYFFMALELSGDVDSYFAYFEENMSIDYTSLFVKRSMISLTEYGKLFLKYCTE